MGLEIYLGPKGLRIRLADTTPELSVFNLHELGLFRKTVFFDFFFVFPHTLMKYFRFLKIEAKNIHYLKINHGFINWNI